LSTAHQPGSTQPHPLQSFWSTLPGILTGIAAVITALAGVAAVVLTMPRGNASPQPSDSSANHTTTTTTTTTTNSEPTTTTPPPPPPTEVVATVQAGGHGNEAYIYRTPNPASEGDLVGVVPHGTTVYIVCTAYGARITSSDGTVTTNLWDFIRPSGPVSVGGYIADTWVYTGTNDPTMPACDGM
jgi:hypothetical protein